MKIRPLQDRVIVRRLEEATTTASGLIIPDTAKEKPQKGEIIAAGPGKRNDDGSLQPMDVKVGDIILMTKWGGTEIKVDDVELLIMNESDIIGVVE